MGARPLADSAPGAPERDDLDRAVAALAGDGLVAYPTETVWGLGARALSPAAVAALRAWKGRDEGHPISLLVSGAAALAELGVVLDPVVRRLVDAFWPGPLTLVVSTPAELRARLAPGIARDDGAVGFRCSPHPVASALARAGEAAGLGPVTATSLNRTGAPAAERRAQARALCVGGPQLLGCRGADAGGGLPSSVVEAGEAGVRVLRFGAIDRSALVAVVGRDAIRDDARSDGAPSDAIPNPTPPAPGVPDASPRVVSERDR